MIWWIVGVSKAQMSGIYAYECVIVKNIACELILTIKIKNKINCNLGVLLKLFALNLTDLLGATEAMVVRGYVCHDGTFIGHGGVLQVCVRIKRTQQ